MEWSNARRLIPRSDLWIGTSIFPSQLQTGSGALHFFNRGPFHKVEEYANGACSIWLASFPEEPLARQRAAKYMGFELPKISVNYGGKPIEISWK
jgi:hypothetical protein